MLTGKQLADYSEAVYRAGWVYWYGTYGRKCSQSLYESKKKQYPSHYTSGRTTGYMRDIREGKWCADCVGMIKSFFWTGGEFETTPKYATNHCPDVSANGMIALCTQTGPISTIPDIPGLVVWKSGHIGVYVGNGYTVEMKGFDYDCKRNRVKDGPWVKWGRLPASMISYDAAPAPESPLEPEGDRDLRNGDEGADVKALQKALIKLGFSCGKWGADGEFGDCTEQAVEAFQRAHGLDVTGVYDGRTREALEAALDAVDAPTDDPRYVRIVGGNCYVRSAPNTSGKKLGVAHEGDMLPYGGQTSDNGWNLVDYKNQNGWVSGKYSKLIDGGGVTRGEKIVDISHHKTVDDYDALIRDTALIILRPGVRKKDGKIYRDDKFAEQSSALLKRGVRFGTFFYSMATNPEHAREEARAYVEYAKSTNPLWWSIDAEYEGITTEAIAAFADELRTLLGNARIGAYIANEKYDRPYKYSTIRHLFDFDWIPCYIHEPDHRCDLWQYTSHGRVAGINEDVDLNRITGEGHDLKWFIEG